MNGFTISGRNFATHFPKPDKNLSPCQKGQGSSGVSGSLRLRGLPESPQRFQRQYVWKREGSGTFRRGALGAVEVVWVVTSEEYEWQLDTGQRSRKDKHKLLAEKEDSPTQSEIELTSDRRRNSREMASPKQRWSCIVKRVGTVFKTVKISLEKEKGDKRKHSVHGLYWKSPNC